MKKQNLRAFTFLFTTVYIKRQRGFVRLGGMKYSAILSILLLFAYGCSNAVRTNLLNEQKILKDSANNVRDRIGGCVQKGVYDSADAKKKQLGTIHTRLIAIQSSLDSLEKNTK